MSKRANTIFRVILFANVLGANLFLFVPQTALAGQELVPAHSIKLAQLPPEAKPPDNSVTYKGVDPSITKFLCTPSNDNLGVGLYECISKLYRFGIAAGALSLVFFVVLAGYFYLTGGESAKAKGKDIFVTSLTGMIILLLSYVLLRFINPNLAQFRPIQPPIFNASLPKCEDIGFESNCVISTGSNSGQVFYAGSSGGGGGAGGSCKTSTSSGNCSVDNMKKCGAWNPQEASKICMRESAGGKLDIASGSDKCKLPSGEIISWSHGLFQFNIATGSALPEFSECKNVVVPGDCIDRRVSSKGVSFCALKTCTFGPSGKPAFDRCVQSITKSQNSLDRQLQQACNLYKRRSETKNWCDWETSAVECNVKPNGFCKR